MCTQDTAGVQRAALASPESKVSSAQIASICRIINVTFIVGRAVPGNWKFAPWFLPIDNILTEKANTGMHGMMESPWTTYAWY